MRVNALRRAMPGSGILLMPAAAVAVHQLRYWLAYGSRANTELAEQGHSYLHSLVPWTIFGIAVGAGLFLRRLGGVLRARSAPETSRLPTGGLWLATWIWLVAIYAMQETLEEFLATGHPAGLAGVLASSAAGRAPPLGLLIGQSESRRALAAVWRKYHVASLPGPDGTISHNAISILIDPKGDERYLLDSQLTARDVIAAMS